MAHLVIVGCGGFGREVYDVVDALRASDGAPSLLGFVADGASDVDLERLQRLGVPFLGGTAQIRQLVDAEYVIGIGNGSVRERIDHELEGCAAAAPLIHPAASIGNRVDLGPGAVICAGARLTTNIRVGRHVHINLNATIGHDAVIEDFVTINPLAALSGNVRVGRGVNVGAGAVILPHVTVDAYAVVGASSCVVHDVPGAATVKGVPAR